MFDFDKLFAKDNIIVLKNQTTGHVYYYTADEFGMNWDDYKTESLSYTTLVNNVINTTFTIQSIVRLNEKGDVVEKLFERKETPQFTTGTFVKIKCKQDENTCLGVVIDDLIVYKDGSYDFLKSFTESSYGVLETKYNVITEVWGPEVKCFNGCRICKPIWKRD